MKKDISLKGYLVSGTAECVTDGVWASGYTIVSESNGQQVRKMGSVAFRATFEKAYKAGILQGLIYVEEVLSSLND